MDKMILGTQTRQTDQADRAKQDLKRLLEAYEGKKLLLFVPSLRRGGAERIMHVLAEQFAEAGVATHLVVVRNDREDAYPEPAGARVTSLLKERLSSQISVDSLVHLIAMFKLAAILKKEKPDVVLSTPDWLNVIAARAVLIAGGDQRLILREASTRSVRESSTSTVVGKILRGYRQVHAKWAYRFADRVIAISEGVREDLLENLDLPSEQVVTVYNPAHPDPQDIANSEPVDVADWLDGERLVVCVANLRPEKDHRTLLKAWPMVRDAVGAKLALVGDGIERKNLEALTRELSIEDSVRFVGSVPDVLPWYKAAALKVLPSRVEGFGNVLVEALACGTQVVATDCPWGPHEILDGGRIGRLVEVGSPPALGKAIVEALRSPDSPRVCKERAKAFMASTSLQAYGRILFA